MRLTSRARISIDSASYGRVAKAGHSGPLIACGSVIAYRIKVTPGITG